MKSPFNIRRSQISGLSPLRDTETNTPELKVEKKKLDVKPDISAGAFSETISNLADYWSQEKGEGKLHSRLEGKEIRKHKPYTEKEQYGYTEEKQIDRQLEDYEGKYQRGRSYIDTEDTANKVVERLMNTKVLTIKDEEQAKQMINFMKRVDMGEVDIMDPSVRNQLSRYINWEAKTATGAHATGSWSKDPKVKLSPSQMESDIYDYKEASGEELYNRLKDILAHELGHITLGSGTEPKKEFKQQADQMYQGEGRMSFKDRYDADVTADEKYGWSIGAMSTRDANIIEDLMDRSGTGDNMGVDWKNMSEQDKHNLSFKEAYADMQAFRSDALDKGIYDWRTQDLDKETLQKYIDSYKGKEMPYAVKRFIKKMTVNKKAGGGENYIEENKYDNLIYMNNVIARGDKEGTQNIGGGVAAQMNPEDYKQS